MNKKKLSTSRKVKFAYLDDDGSLTTRTNSFTDILRAKSRARAEEELKVQGEYCTNMCRTTVLLTTFFRAYS